MLFCTVPVYVCIDIYIYEFAGLHLAVMAGREGKHMYLQVYVSTCVNMCIYIYMCNLHAYIYIYIYIYIHTYIHTCIQQEWNLLHQKRIHPCSWFLRLWLLVLRVSGSRRTARVLCFGFRGFGFRPWVSEMGLRVQV